MNDDWKDRVCGFGSEVRRGCESAELSVVLMSRGTRGITPDILGAMSMKVLIDVYICICMDLCIVAIVIE